MNENKEEMKLWLTQLRQTNRSIVLENQKMRNRISYLEKKEVILNNMYDNQKKQYEEEIEIHKNELNNMKKSVIMERKKQIDELKKNSQELKGINERIAEEISAMKNKKANSIKKNSFSSLKSSSNSRIGKL